MKTSISDFSTIKKQDDYRWDSEFICFEPIVNQRYKYKKIGDILAFAQYGISVGMNEDNEGYKIYRMNEITDMFCDQTVLKYADIDNSEASKFILKNDDVLFNRTNSQEMVGRTGLFKKFSEEPYIFASYLVRVRPKKDIVLPEYLTTFLNTQYGIDDVKRRARISINQSNVSASELKRISIPLLSLVFQGVIKELHNEAFELLLKANTLYKEAENILLKHLEFENWKPARKLFFTNMFKDVKSTERIDAEYFKPSYEELLKKIQDCPDKVKKLGDLLKIRDSNFTPRDEDEYKYIELANIANNGEINGYLEEVGKNLPTRARRKVRKGDVIISSIEGSLESIALIGEELNGALCSTGFYVVTSEGINSETLLVFMKSVIGQMQLKRGCSGTILTAIGKDEFKKILIPQVNSKIQEAIKETIDEMYIVRNKSKKLRRLAIRAVEIAIEESEKKAQEFIEAKLKIN